MMTERSHSVTHVETRFFTETGVPIRTRLIEPDDAPLLVDLFAHLSSQTRRRRFNVALENVEENRIWAMAEELADVDNHTQGGAILALAEDGPTPSLIGVVRLARPQGTPHSETAEVAVVIRDDYQRQGIGGRLLQLLFPLALDMGISVLTATIQADNEAALNMLRALDLPVETHTSHGETDVRIKLNRQAT